MRIAAILWMKKNNIKKLAKLKRMGLLKEKKKTYQKGCAKVFGTPEDNTGKARRGQHEKFWIISGNQHSTRSELIKTKM